MEEIWVLKKIKINDELQDVVAKSTDDYVTVVYDGPKINLAKALSNIKEEIKKIPCITPEQFASDSDIKDIFGI